MIYRSRPFRTNDRFLKYFDDFYEQSSDINSLINDLLEINHNITLYKTIKSEDSLTTNKSQFEKIKNIANNIKLSDLTKIWQMLLKGLKELSISRVGVSPECNFLALFEATRTNSNLLGNLSIQSSTVILAMRGL